MRATGPGQPVSLLLDVADLLNELHIPYAVIGALAVSFHGIPRSTNDGDAIVWLEEIEKSGEILTERLVAAGFRAVRRVGESDDPISGVIVLEDEHKNRMDLLLGIRGMDPGAAGRSVASSLLGVTVRFAGAEDLIAMKLFAGSPMDLDDVRGILQVSGRHLDLNLLGQLARRYGIEVKRKLDVILKNATSDPA